MARKLKFSSDGTPIAAGTPDNQATHAKPAVVCSVNEAIELNQAAAGSSNNAKNTVNQLQMTVATREAVDVIQSDDYLGEFYVAPTGPNATEEELEDAQEDVLGKLQNLFMREEISIGLLNKLLLLQKRIFNIVGDDSISMGAETKIEEAKLHPFLKQKINTDRAERRTIKLTRLMEQLDRMLKLADFLVLIPTGNIQFSFLNDRFPTTLTPAQRKGKPVDQVAKELHEALYKRYSEGTKGATPLKGCVEEAFSLPITQGQKYCHIFYTDGVPNDGLDPIGSIKNMVKNRNAEAHAVTFGSVTDNDEEVAWMKQLDEIASSVAEIDDFETEYSEVCKAQGKGFPFNRGVMLICELVAAIDPHCLDALDEPKVLSPEALSDFYGYQLTKDSRAYKEYLSEHPHLSPEQFANLNANNLTSTADANFYPQYFDHLIQKQKGVAVYDPQQRRDDYKMMEARAFAVCYFGLARVVQEENAQPSSNQQTSSIWNWGSFNSNSEIRAITESRAKYQEYQAHHYANYNNDGSSKVQLGVRTSSSMYGGNNSSAQPAGKRACIGNGL